MKITEWLEERSGDCVWPINEHGKNWKRKLLNGLKAKEINYPGETKKSILKTLDLMHRIKPDDAWLCIATPYPGTELRTLVEKMGLKMSNDWTLYNTMNSVFENPLVPTEELSKVRKAFYDSLYSPQYILRQFVKGNLKGNFYSKIMTRTAINYLLWRIMSKKWRILIHS